jgi:hypothetical protein
MSTSLSNKSISGSLTVTGDTSVSGKLSVNAASGEEGGEIFLAQPISNNTLNGGITIDVYQNKLRFFEQGGSARGFYIDMTTGGSGASTNILSGGGGGIELTDLSATSPIVYNSSTGVFSLSKIDGGTP